MPGFEEWLEQRSAAELERLLHTRPDVLWAPTPGSTGVVAQRLQSPHGVDFGRASIDLFATQLLEALCVLPKDATIADLAAMDAAVDAGVVSAGLERLRDHGLVWGDDAAIRLVGGVRDAVRFPFRLGRPFRQCVGRHQVPELVRVANALRIAVPKSRDKLVAAIAHELARPAAITALLERAPDGATQLLTELDAGGPLATITGVGYAGRRLGDNTPLGWLLAHGLLVSVDWNVAEVPREVGLALRGGVVCSFEPDPPALSSTRPLHVDDAAGHAAVGLLARVEALLEECSEAPVPLLTSGGIGVREIRRLAKLLDVDERSASILVELAAVARLVSPDYGVGAVPTTGYDAWLAEPPEARWAELVRSWLRTARLPGLAGLRDVKNKPIPALIGFLATRDTAAVRREILAELAAFPEGTGADVDSLVERTRWRRPAMFRGGHGEAVVRSTLEEATLLGLAHGGALSAAGRLVAAGAVDAARELMAARMPRTTVELTVQADLTVVAGGRLDAGLAREVALLADVESTGAATVYRISEASVRRALDAGRSADEVLGLLARHAPRGLPQTLDYLVRDVARRHGALRVGAAKTYLRCDDPALLAEAVRSRKAAALGLRLIAPTVALSAKPVEATVAALRAAGLAPMPEGADGAVLVAKPAAHRASMPRPPADQAVSPEEIAALVARWKGAARTVRTAKGAKGAKGAKPARSATKAARPAPAPRAPEPRAPEPRAPEPRQSALSLVPDMAEPTSLVELLEQAMDGDMLVEIDYVDVRGTLTTRVVEPEEIEAGQLFAWCRLRDDERCFNLDQIDGARIVGSRV